MDKLAARNAHAVATGNGTYLSMVGATGKHATGSVAAAGNAGEAATKAVSRMSGGKIAAIVAGVGLLAGAGYLLSRPSQDKRSWTSRIDEERSNAKGAVLGA